MIIKITSNTMNILWKIILFFIMCLVVLLLALHHGVNFDRLVFPGVNVSGLYIKLDKKFFVEIDKIEILENKKQKNVKNVNNSLDSFDVVLNQIPILQKFFKKIAINELKIGDATIVVKYEDGYIFVDDSKFLTLQAAIISYNDGEIELDIKELALKDYNISLSGNLSGNIKETIYNFFGNYTLLTVNGEITLKFADNLLSYKLNSNEFNYHDFEYLMDNLFSHVSLNEDAKSWIYKYIKAKSYKLLNLEGRYNIQTNNFYQNELIGSAIARNIDVEFHENLTSAYANEAHVEFKNNNLNISIKDGNFKGLKLNNNSYVFLEDIAGSNFQVKVNLYTNELFDARIKEIVDAYGVEIPLNQTTGKNDAFVGIYVNIEPFDVNIFGSFNVTNSNFTLSDAPFFTPHARIELNNSIIDFINSNILIDNMLNATLNATLNAEEKIMHANTTINNFNLDANEVNLVSIKDFNTSFTMHLIDDGVKFIIDDFDAILTFSNVSSFEFKSIDKIYEFIPLAKQNNITNGMFVIETENFSDFFGKVKLRDVPNIPLKLNDEIVDSFDGEFSIVDNILHVRTDDDTIEVTVGDEINVSIKNINVLIDTDNPSIKQSFNQKRENSKTNGDLQKQTPLNLLSQNSSIVLFPSNITIYSKSYNVNIDENGSIFADFYDGYGRLNAEKIGENFEIYANDFTSSFINNLIQRDFFVGGKFSVLMSGESINDLSGIFSMENTKLKDFALANNIGAFINTIPALATLNNPRFSFEGYPVRDGSFEFTKIENIIFIQNLFLEGYSVDVMGYGYIDLSTKDIFLNLKISTLKSLGRLIGKIPLVNFIILGDDGRITISIAVRGKYDNPEVRTNVIAGAISSPLNVIKRIFLLPRYLFFQ